MQDRIPVNPGRVLISPENGAPYYATMTRADNATQEGTPLNKNSLLKDATAALFGLGANAVPDDVFRLLSRFQSGLGNEYVWKKLNMDAAYKEVQTLDGSSGGMIAIIDGTNATTPTYTFQYADEISIDSSGNVSLVSPKTFEANYTTFASNYMSAFLGKYFTTSNDFHVGKIFFTPTSASIRAVNNRQVLVEPAYVVTSKYYDADAFVGYVNSLDPNAYPPVVDDGFTYTAVGQLGAKVQIATGSYTGTGTYGASKPNSLTFNFTPSIVFLWCDLVVNGNKRCAPVVVYPWGANGFYASDMHVDAGSTTLLNMQGVYNAVTLNGNTISWYSGKDANTQLNAKDISGSNNFTYEYKYLAIG